MNLIELLVVLAAARSEAPLAVGPLDQAQDRQGVKRESVCCRCLPADELKVKWASGKRTRARSSVGETGDVRKGVDQTKLNQERRKALVVYRAR